MQELSLETRLRVVPYLNILRVRRNENVFELDVLECIEDERVATITLDHKGLAFFKEFLTTNKIGDVAHKHNVAAADALEFCSELLAQRILTAFHFEQPNLGRYHRHLLFYDMTGVDASAVQTALLEKSIAICGVGGIGNWVATGLIGLGLKEIRLFDFDVIELTNLTRQILFTEADIGKAKIEVAAERLRAMNSTTKITTVSCANEEGILLERLDDIDFLVLSADKPNAIHNWVDDVCMRMNIPYITAGYINECGIVGPLVQHGTTACYECFQPRRRDRTSDEFSDLLNHMQAPSFGPLNALVSSTTVVELVKFLGNFGSVVSLGTRLIINPLDLNSIRTLYKRDPQCWHCGFIPYKTTDDRFMVSQHEESGVPSADGNR